MYDFSGKQSLPLVRESTNRTAYLVNRQRPPTPRELRSSLLILPVMTGKAEEPFFFAGDESTLLRDHNEIFNRNDICRGGQMCDSKKNESQGQQMLQPFPRSGRPFSRACPDMYGAINTATIFPLFRRSFPPVPRFFRPSESEGFPQPVRFFRSNLVPRRPEEELRGPPSPRKLPVTRHG